MLWLAIDSSSTVSIPHNYVDADQIRSFNSQTWVDLDTSFDFICGSETASLNYGLNLFQFFFVRIYCNPQFHCGFLVVLHIDALIDNSPSLSLASATRSTRRRLVYIPRLSTRRPPSRISFSYPLSAILIAYLCVCLFNPVFCCQRSIKHVYNIYSKYREILWDRLWNKQGDVVQLYATFLLARVHFKLSAVTLWKWLAFCLHYAVWMTAQCAQKSPSQKSHFTSKWPCFCVAYESYRFV